RRRVLEVPRQLSHLTLEVGQVSKRLHLEHRHEAPVIVPPAGLHAKSKARQQAAQDLHDDRQAAALVALRASQRQQRATRSELVRIRSLTPVTFTYLSQQTLLTT